MKKSIAHALTALIPVRSVRRNVRYKLKHNKEVSVEKKVKKKFFSLKEVTKIMKIGRASCRERV